MLYMNCKYPIFSRSFMACTLCKDKYLCTHSTNYILPANKANKMTKEVIDNCCTSQLSEISQKIKQAIADGNFFISENRYNLKPETQMRLKKLGYRVDINEYDESYYIISWE